MYDTTQDIQLNNVLIIIYYYIKFMDVKFVEENYILMMYMIDVMDVHGINCNYHLN